MLSKLLSPWFLPCFLVKLTSLIEDVGISAESRNFGHFANGGIFLDSWHIPLSSLSTESFPSSIMVTVILYLIPHFWNDYLLFYPYREEIIEPLEIMQSSELTSVATNTWPNTMQTGNWVSIKLNKYIEPNSTLPPRDCTLCQEEGQIYGILYYMNPIWLSAIRLT
ncbi:hypothetical protein DL96DRAFT_1566615 [Flagelloscypha sp. PMI_526]|nr:hypothetical protein DL96DRAFT_1566615 [Flagelloscypha sp. PMI_526]